MWAPLRKSIDNGEGRSDRERPSSTTVARHLLGGSSPPNSVRLSEHHAGLLVIAYARGEDLQEAGAFGSAGLPVAVKALLYGLVHALQLALVDVAGEGSARHHAAGGVDLEALGAGAGGAVVHDAPPGVGAGVDELTLGVEAAIYRA